jgi:1,2-phenylacetyl-CoA epoxidase catalytic subunit
VDRDARRAAACGAHGDCVLTDVERTGSGLFETATDQEAIEKAVAAAAPISVERADLAMVTSLDPALRKPMFALLSSLADNKYVLGRRYAEWCTGAPMLESAVAAAAMAQDELGHARSFYPLLRGFPAGRDITQMEEKGWQQRSTSAMACLDQRFSTWSDFLAANLLIDTALSVLFFAATESAYEPLRQRARKIVQEEAGHWVHGAGWLRRSPPGLSRALAGMWDDAFTWFGQSNDPVVAPLAAAGLLSETPDGLRAALSARLEPVVTGAGLASELFPRELPWSRWSPTARRLHA